MYGFISEELKQMFRRLIIFTSIAVAMAGSAVLAQGLQRGDKLRDAAADRLLQRIQQRINLTDAQMNGIHALQEKRRMEIESLRHEIKPQKQALRQLLRQPSPNPTDVGKAALGLRDNTQDQMRDINQRFFSGVKELLTPEQLRRLPKRLR
jgi:hypothetical protein